MDVTALEIFVDVVRRGSFAAVARDRDADPSAISRTIASLEEELGGRLFQRTTRRLALTEAGTVFFDRVQPMIEELRGARESVAEANTHARGTLRVTTSVSFGQRRLVPLLPRFMALYPDLTIDLLLTESVVDIIAEGIDVAIRLGHLTESGLVARRLLRTSYVVCASPAYLAAHAEIRRPEDLRDHECLLLPFPGFRTRWIFRERKSQTREVPVRGRVVISTAVALQQCAVAGMGVTLLPNWMVADDIASGVLKRVLGDYDVTASDFETGIWMVYPTRAHLPLKVRVFSDFLRKSLKEARV